MTAPAAKIHIPEVVDRFRRYNAQHGAWGSLHIVLDDGNVDDDSVKFCCLAAKKRGDEEGAALARILLQMSRSQRLRLPHKANTREQAEREARFARFMGVL